MRSPRCQTKFPAFSSGKACLGPAPPTAPPTSPRLTGTELPRDTRLLRATHSPGTHITTVRICMPHRKRRNQRTKNQGRLCTIDSIVKKIELYPSLSMWAQWYRNSIFIFVKGDFFYFYVRYSTLLHLPPLRFHCVEECWDGTQDRWTLELTARRSNHSARSHPLSRLGLIPTRLGLIPIISNDGSFHSWASLGEILYHWIYYAMVGHSDSQYTYIHKNDTYQLRFYWPSHRPVAEFIDPDWGDKVNSGI